MKNSLPDPKNGIDYLKAYEGIPNEKARMDE